MASGRQVGISARICSEKEATVLDDGRIGRIHCHSDQAMKVGVNIACALLEVHMCKR